MPQTPPPSVRSGDRFTVARPLSVECLIHWRAPFTSGVSAIIPEGTVLVATQDAIPEATAFNAVPENHEELEQQVIPAADRRASTYDGYSILVPLDTIGVSVKRLKHD